MKPLIDSFGRLVGDLRISVIDRCNLRCGYCMPAEGLPWLKRDVILTVDEIHRLATLFVAFGVREIKITGGEPTTRAEVVEIVRRLRSIDASLELSMTTNGLRLSALAGPLREAGLDRVTVSCDSLVRHRYEEMTRRDALDAVLEGLDAVEREGLPATKINCVVIKGTNDTEILDFVHLARDTGREVRFIEYMPLDAQQAWERSKVAPSSDIRRKIESRHELVADGNGGPATRYRFADGTPGAVAFISSVTDPFCETCNRVRLTADGQMRACLFALEETDLRTPLREGASDETLGDLIRQNVSRKWAGHRINHPDFVRPTRSMSQIGG